MEIRECIYFFRFVCLKNWMSTSAPRPSRVSLFSCFTTSPKSPSHPIPRSNAAPYSSTGIRSYVSSVTLFGRSDKSWASDESKRDFGSWFCNNKGSELLELFWTLLAFDSRVFAPIIWSPYFLSVEEEDETVLDSSVIFFLGGRETIIGWVGGSASSPSILEDSPLLHWLTWMCGMMRGGSVETGFRNSTWLSSSETM